jgi:DNA processing protein
MKFSMIDATLKKHNIKIVTLHDSAYPILLKNISHPPYLIYVRGDLRDTTNLISAVGSRKNSKYAEIALEKIIPDLIRAGFGVVSGGAYGVDALAHSITLEHEGYTIAVVGTGVDLVYPAQNRELFANILKSDGAIISIFPLSTRAEIYNFPIRNEIVAAMSR